MTKCVGLARACVCAVVLIGSAAAAGPAHALDISPRYASPTGSGSDCLRDSPCSIIEAINNSPSDREVIIEPGVYGSPGSPLTTTLTDESSSGLNVHGQVGAPDPVVYSSAATNAVALVNGSSLSHLSVVSTGSGGAVIVIDASTDHLFALATAAASYACANFGDLTDSLCVATGANGAAVEIEAGGPQTRTSSLDNVTAIATNGDGIVTTAGSGTNLTVATTDSIVRGTQDDVAASADGSSTVAVDFNHSAYRPTQVVTSGSATVDNVDGNTSANPKFVKPGAGDFREAAGSPTIDAGAQRLAADTDLAGNPRTLGMTTDIGAYEFLSKPTVGKIHVGHKGTHALAVKVPVNPEGLATSVRLVARHGHQHKTSHQVLAGNERTDKTINLKVKGLKAGTKYHLSVKATNDGGTASHNTTTKTKAKPKHKHHHHSRA